MNKRWSDNIICVTFISTQSCLLYNLKNFLDIAPDGNSLALNRKYMSNPSVPFLSIFEFFILLFNFKDNLGIILFVSLFYIHFVPELESVTHVSK